MKNLNRRYVLFLKFDFLLITEQGFITIDMNEMKKGMNQTNHYQQSLLMNFTFIEEPAQYFQGSVIDLSFDIESKVESKNSTIVAHKFMRGYYKLSDEKLTPSKTRDNSMIDNRIDLDCYEYETIANYTKLAPGVVPESRCTDIKITSSNIEKIDGFRWKSKLNSVQTKRHYITQSASKSMSCGVQMQMRENRIYFCQQNYSFPTKSYFIIRGYDAKWVKIQGIEYGVNIAESVMIRLGKVLFLFTKSDKNKAFTNCNIFEIVEELSENDQEWDFDDKTDSQDKTIKEYCNKKDKYWKYKKCVEDNHKKLEKLAKKYNITIKQYTKLLKLKISIVPIITININRSITAPFLIKPQKISFYTGTNSDELNEIKHNKHSLSDLVYNMNAYEEYVIGTLTLEKKPGGYFLLIIQSVRTIKKGYEDHITTNQWTAINPLSRKYMKIFRTKDSKMEYLFRNPKIVTVKQYDRDDITSDLKFVIMMPSSNDIIFVIPYKLIVRDKTEIEMSEIKVKFQSNNFYGLTPTQSPYPVLTKRHYVSVRNFVESKNNFGYQQAYDVRTLDDIKSDMNIYNHHVHRKKSVLASSNTNCKGECKAERKYDLGLGQMLTDKLDLGDFDDSDYYLKSKSPYVTTKINTTKVLNIFDLVSNFTTPNEFRVFTMDMHHNLYTVILSPTIDIRFTNLFVASKRINMFVTGLNLQSESYHIYIKDLDKNKWYHDLEYYSKMFMVAVIGVLVMMFVMHILHRSIQIQKTILNVEAAKIILAKNVKAKGNTSRTRNRNDQSSMMQLKDVLTDDFSDDKANRGALGPTANQDIFKLDSNVPGTEGYWKTAIVNSPNSDNILTSNFVNQVGKKDNKKSDLMLDHLMKGLRGIIILF